MAVSNPARPRVKAASAPVDPSKPKETGAPVMTMGEKTMMMAEAISPDEIIPPVNAEKPTAAPKDEVIDVGSVPPLGVSTEELQAQLEEKRKTKARLAAEKTTKKWLGMGLTAFAASGDMYCATAVGVNGKEIAESVGMLAEQFPWLAETLDSSDKYAAIVGVVWSLGRLGLTIAAHHNAVPYNNFTAMLIPDPSKPYPMKAKTDDGSISFAQNPMG